MSTDPEPSELLRDLPSVDRLCGSDRALALIGAHGRDPVVAAIRDAVEHVREEILHLRKPVAALRQESTQDSILKDVERRIESARHPELCRVVNATGIILHTGLGRAPLPKAALNAIASELQGYALLSVDREAGRRVNREHAVARLICKLTGAEHATVVNNNAAAVLLALAALAQGKQVIVSRGQLVEIGGSFRMPEIMAQAGVRLVEVGTTNKTYLADFEQALTPETALLSSIHTSNFKIVGFAQEVAIEDLVSLGKRANLPVMYDVGSGLLVNLSPRGVGAEPTVQEGIKAGVDIVCFSCDKMMGGPQAGVIAGKRHLVTRIRRHPLFRTYRLDKLRLAALEATLKLYADSDRVFETNPTLRMVAMDCGTLDKLAGQIARQIRKMHPDLEVAVQDEVSHLGGGAMPGQDLPTRVVAVRSPKISAQALSDALRLGGGGIPPIFARVKKDWVLFDPRTLLPEDTKDIVEGLKTACAG